MTDYKTSMKIWKSTRDKIKARGEYGETLDQILNRLLSGKEPKKEKLKEAA